tara:strand:- start:1372 stop:2076 length:705 start_codon:yes stop_codon:yes gene_type:complete
MSVSRKLKWKRALSRLRFCYDELEYTRESSKVAAVEFEVYYRKYCAENNIDIADLDQKNKQRLDNLYGRDNIAADDAEQKSYVDTEGDTSIVLHDGSAPTQSPDYEMTADDIAMHESFSKLFKQIALKLHPDRIDKAMSKDEAELRINMFQEANQAFEDRKYYFLLDLADKYNISVPKNYELQTRWMKRESERIVGVVDKEKNTYNFSFSQAETEEEKIALIKKFIYQVFRVIA